VDAEPASLADADRALIERLAGRVVALRLEAPALLALESARPLTFVAAQALVFFQPFAQALLPAPDVERLAALLERREAVEALASRIEALAAARRRR